MPKNEMERKIDRAKRAAAAGIRRGRQVREVAPSRSTGHRRELQAHSEALLKVREILSAK